MALTYGFYNSVNGDRVYDALDVGRFFEGILVDGVYEDVGDKFEVTEWMGMTIRVKTGRAWFNFTWTLNDSNLLLDVDPANPLLTRIDIVYLEVNEEVGVRANSIDILTGTPASDPVPPELTNTATIHQYALAHINVKAGATVITDDDITQIVGTLDTPYASSGLYSPLAPGSVQAIHLANGSVIAGKIAALAINGSNLFASGVVNASALATGSVSSTKLSANSVIAGKIAAGGVSASNQFASGVVDNSALAANAVTNAKILDNTITAAKMVNRTRNLYIAAASMHNYNATIFIELCGMILAFDWTEDERVFFGVHVPLDWISGNLVSKLYWTGSVDIPGNVVWELSYIRMNQGYEWGGGMNTIQEIVPYLGFQMTNITTFDSFPIASGEVIQFKLERNANHISDTFNHYSEVIGCAFEYTADS